jgi:hypothetical protein
MWRQGMISAFGHPMYVCMYVCMCMLLTHLHFLVLTLLQPKLAMQRNLSCSSKSAWILKATIFQTISPSHHTCTRIHTSDIQTYTHILPQKITMRRNLSVCSKCTRSLTRWAPRLRRPRPAPFCLVWVSLWSVFFLCTCICCVYAYAVCVCLTRARVLMRCVCLTHARVLMRCVARVLMRCVCV